MAEIQQAQRCNALLARLDSAEYARIAPRLETVELGHSAVLVEAGAQPDWVYFPETAVASVVECSDPIRLEIAVIGFEGFVGIPQLLGAGSSPYAVVVQVPGRLLRMSSEAFQAALAASPGLSDSLLRYAQAFIVQVSSTAASTAFSTVEVRLARRLLMVHDRIKQNKFDITHDILARLLDIRRPGVTVATHVLEGEGTIKALRGRIVIRDRQRLIKAAQGSYGVAEAEYVRLLGEWRDTA